MEEDMIAVRDPKTIYFDLDSIKILMRIRSKKSNIA